MNTVRKPHSWPSFFTLQLLGPLHEESGDRRGFKRDPTRMAGDPDVPTLGCNDSCGMRSLQNIHSLWVLKAALSRADPKSQARCLL